MRHIHLIDTSIGSDNIGDEIIVQEAKKHLLPLLTDAYISTSAGHDGLGNYSRDIAASADAIVLLGTNALSAKYKGGSKYIWHVERQDLPILREKVVLFGVGANRDFRKIDRKQLKFLKHVLSPNHIHSVRDETAARIVRACGLDVLNTSCPTLWTEPTVNADRASPATTVCFTLTKHKGDPADLDLLHVLQKTYEEVWFWPQQPRDLAYLQQMVGRQDVKVLPANLTSYDAFLAGRSVDVVGTRLHGTIRGLLHGQRSIVVAIDNRARDIGAETGLPTIARADVNDQLANLLDSDFTTTLQLPTQNIAKFLAQFRVS
ncbi:polysaccharide pyruvyl transferase family protein [Yoonia sp. F2084L]|uniref:polysaccharide pyruvyl transferase family protein n=1 Tax=Yoonia sp. F2084L TaxID=2926419 RepID=UPI001FF5CD65|nr:polysaccharide pyruvyl transferase family protein [Yoonia sp. F2084L]MCK0095132.1 polysaccharide pyruvyl transferase family protein [Yoonia sp. F2084L]